MHGEVNNIKKDGALFWSYANVSLFDHPQYGRVIVSVHTDITEQKKAKETLKKVKKGSGESSNNPRSQLKYMTRPVI